jgi:ATP-dependent DNA helicase RecQ
MKAIYNQLFSLNALQNKTHQQAKNYLQLSSEGSIKGIGKWLEKAEVKEGDEKEFEIFFTNLYSADRNAYLKHLKNAIIEKWGEDSIPKSLDQSVTEDLEDFLIRLNYKAKIDFEEILKDEESWRLLSNAFYSEREKEDTDKAIYRLHSIGIVEDYTIDYRQGKYLVKVKKLSKAQYFDHYRAFLTRYYSERKAEQEIQKLHEAYANLYLKAFLNELLKHLVGLIYQEIANKRLRAIDDMMTACKTGINEGNHAMKQFVYLYFNSKYARIGYQIDNEDYNLVSENHTSNGKEQNLEIVWKFIEAIGIDPTGSQQDNLKHLRGACMRILRANPENASAQLLKSFSLLILAERNKNLLNEAEDDFLAGFQNFQKQYQQWSFNQFYQEAILQFQEKVRENTNDQEVLTKLEKMVEYLYLTNHNEWLRSFKPQFLADYG